MNVKNVFKRSQIFLLNEFISAFSRSDFTAFFRCVCVLFCLCSLVFFSSFCLLFLLLLGVFICYHFNMYPFVCVYHSLLFDSSSSLCVRKVFRFSHGHYHTELMNHIDLNGAANAMQIYTMRFHSNE